MIRLTPQQDGLLFSDHTPNPGLVSTAIFDISTVADVYYKIELKKTYAPVRGWVEGDQLVIENEYLFNGLDHLSADMKIEVFGDRSVSLLSCQVCKTE